MSSENTVRAETPTRRQYLKLGGSVVGGGLFAGCLNDDRADSMEADPDGTYSVTMAPTGAVTFSDVPENVLVYSLLYADMAVAYGHGDSINSLGFDAEAEGQALNSFYDVLEGVSFDGSDLTQLNTGSGSVTIDKELFYELDSDLHLLDPCLVSSMDGWDRSDVEEIKSTVGPWFGNTYSREHAEPPEECRDDYQYYTLWEIAENVAAVFQARDRFEALTEVHEELIRSIQLNLPPEDERPTVGSVIVMDETFYPSETNASGFATADLRPFEVPDAFAAEDITYETAYDYETMLEIDPDILLHRFGIASYDVDHIRGTLEDHPVASQLTAVENDRVYASGNPIQGPIMNLFQLEMAAKQLYPDQFGEWPGYGGDTYPEIPEDEQLFDRDYVAAVIQGDF
ncbi:ABC transporter substrate-binding protein [Halostagnicola sp. A-GB9-2]|uniref:ABC transporter substrate-binding protein n=1 Tax=Halostagnicola sp. A-GB9-2 TaxID=3048066 RepID=UPI0024BFB092|nr:ABC transporter substrate-binding protein [Halostagnicola sp. A-GB9-2]MDJ1433093.1 ABC transporter substrate-binding protein [Halostagnicola sp. A-GB9-2]